MREGLPRCDLVLDFATWRRCRPMVRSRRFSMYLRASLRSALIDPDFDWRTCVATGAGFGGASGHRVSVEIPHDDMRMLDQKLDEHGRAPRQHALRGLVLRVLDERPWE